MHKIIHRKKQFTIYVKFDLQRRVENVQLQKVKCKKYRYITAVLGTRVTRRHPLSKFP